jgi:hypothetical protein
MSEASDALTVTLRFFRSTLCAFFFLLFFCRCVVEPSSGFLNRLRASGRVRKERPCGPEDDAVRAGQDQDAFDV